MIKAKKIPNPTFKERVDLAIKKVKKLYPNAELYEIDGIASEGLTNNPAYIDQLRIIFRNNEKSTIIIKSTGWNTFGDPIYIPYSWCEEKLLNWPLNMDIEHANNLKEKAGYKSSYKIIAIRNPYYIFGINHSEPYIFVDSQTENVFSGD